MIKLKKVDSSNLWEIVNLTVHDDQKSFVATNTESILEAYITITSGYTALPFGIYSGDMLVGFVMFGYDTTGDEEEPGIERGCLRQDSIALSSRFPMITQRSISDICSSDGTTALALTVMFFDLISDSFEFRIASIITLPVLMTVSTVVRSSFSFRRYSCVCFSSPDRASKVWIWL